MAQPLRFYTTRRQAHGAWWRIVRKASRKGRSCNVAVCLSPYGYYLKVVPVTGKSFDIPLFDICQ